VAPGSAEASRERLELGEHGGEPVRNHGPTG
jgi:hypothetical protein